MSLKLEKLIFEEIDKLINKIPKDSKIDCIFICSKWRMSFNKMSYNGYNIYSNPMVKDGMIYGVEYKEYKKCLYNE